MDNLPSHPSRHRDRSHNILRAREGIDAINKAFGRAKLQLAPARLREVLSERCQALGLVISVEDSLSDIEHRIRALAHQLGILVPDGTAPDEVMSQVEEYTQARVDSHIVLRESLDLGPSVPRERDDEDSALEILGEHEAPQADEETRIAKIKSLSTKVRSAFLAYEEARIVLETEVAKVTDQIAWEWLGENSSDYDRPSFDTFSRHLRTARKKLGESKNTPTAGRRGRSIVGPSDA